MTVGISQPNVYPLALQMVEEGYPKEEPGLFNPEKVQFFLTQWAYASSAWVSFSEKRQQQHSCWGTSWQRQCLLQKLSQAGAISISGMTSIAQLPFLVAACDYTLIGDEMLVAGAYLAQDPVEGEYCRAGLGEVGGCMPDSCWGHFGDLWQQFIGQVAESLAWRCFD